MSLDPREFHMQDQHSKLITTGVTVFDKSKTRPGYLSSRSGVKKMGIDRIKTIGRSE